MSFVRVRKVSRSVKFLLIALVVAGFGSFAWTVWRGAWATTMYGPLLDAVEAGNVTAVKQCLAQGADPNMASGGGTALAMAKRKGFGDIVQILKQAGAKE